MFAGRQGYKLRFFQPTNRLFYEAPLTKKKVLKDRMMNNRTNIAQLFFGSIKITHKNIKCQFDFKTKSHVRKI